MERFLDGFVPTILRRYLPIWKIPAGIESRRITMIIYVFCISPVLPPVNNNWLIHVVVVTYKI